MGGGRTQERDRAGGVGDGRPRSGGVGCARDAGCWRPNGCGSESGLEEGRVEEEEAAAGGGELDPARAGAAGLRGACPVREPRSSGPVRCTQRGFASRSPGLPAGAAGRAQREGAVGTARRPAPGPGQPHPALHPLRRRLHLFFSVPLYTPYPVAGIPVPVPASHPIFRAPWWRRFLCAAPLLGMGREPAGSATSVCAVSGQPALRGPQVMAG